MGWWGGRPDWSGRSGIASIQHFSKKFCCEREQRSGVVAGGIYMDKGGGLVFAFLSFFFSF